MIAQGTLLPNDSAEKPPVLVCRGVKSDFIFYSVDILGDQSRFFWGKITLRSGNAH